MVVQSPPVDLVIRRPFGVEEFRELIGDEFQVFVTSSGVGGEVEGVGAEAGDDCRPRSLQIGLRGSMKMLRYARPSR